MASTAAKTAKRESMELAEQDPFAPQSWTRHTGNTTEVHLLEGAAPPPVTVEVTELEDGLYLLVMTIAGGHLSVSGTREELQALGATMEAKVTKVANESERGCIETTLAAAGHQGFLIRALQRLRTTLEILLGNRRPARRPVDLNSHDPPGQVVIASPHVTNGPPRLRIAALMRWTEATPI
jgi:hypothetical protein